MNYDWVQPTLERISDILRMPDQHNSYGTPKVDPRVAWEAVHFFWPCTSPSTSVPRVHPNKNGGIEFIWSGTDMEIMVLANPDSNPTVHFLRGAFREGSEFNTTEQILQAGLLQIDCELYSSRSEAP